MADWTPEQIEAAAEAVGELRRGWGNPAYDWMLAYKALSAVDLSDHDRAVAADALRQAANDLEHPPEGTTPLALPEVIGWLQARAEAVGDE